MYISESAINGYQVSYNKYCGQSETCNTNEDKRKGNFSTLQNALEACENRTSCKMILDRGCDNMGPFELCFSENVCESHEGSCIFKKP